MAGHATTTEDIVWAFKLLLARLPEELDLERNRVHFRTSRELTDWLLSLPEFESSAARRRQFTPDAEAAKWAARLFLHTDLSDSEAEAWARKGDNLDTFMLELLASEARRQRVAAAHPRASTDVTIALSKSMPRSGHHLLMNLMCEYFSDAIHYCEFYGGGDACCHATPCQRPYHPLLKNRLFVQKSHDFEFQDSTELPHPSIIQYRHPIPLLQSNYDHACREGRSRSREDFTAFATADRVYYIRFYQKWIQTPGPRSTVLAYEDLVAQPRLSLTGLVRFLEPGTTPTEADLQRALSLLPLPSASAPQGEFTQRSVENYEFFDARLYRDIEAEIFAACPGLQLDRMF